MKEEQESEPKKRGWKLKAMAFFLILVIGGGVYIYFWYQDTNKLRKEAQVSIQKAENYEALNSKIETEYNRCQEFISQKEGSFGNFEYCKGYMDWYKEITLR